MSETRITTDYHNWSFDMVHDDSLDVSSEKIKWEDHRKIMYKKKDGTEKDRTDFVQVHTSLSGAPPPQKKQCHMYIFVIC